VIVRRPRRRGLGVDYGPTMAQLTAPGGVPMASWIAPAEQSFQNYETSLLAGSLTTADAVAASAAAGLPTTTAGSIGFWIQQNATLLLVLGGALLVFGMMSGGRRR